MAKTQEDHLAAVESEAKRLRDVAGTEGYPHLANSIADIGEAVAFLLAKGRKPVKASESKSASN